jgi:hypothetical protein
MGRKRMLWLALATMMLVPSKTRARGRAYAALTRDGALQKQTRRRAERPPQSLPRVVSPCGRHVVEVARGAVFVDGRRVHPDSGSVYLMAPPTWRRDGRALAWLERGEGETRLVVVPELGAHLEALPWALPVVSPDDQIFWAGANRVVVGPALLSPRAVASWTASAR